MHLPPIPAGYVIFAAVLLFAFVLVLTGIRRAVRGQIREARREMGRQLRQSFVAGFAAGSGAGWMMGRRALPPAPPRCRTVPR